MMDETTTVCEGLEATGRGDEMRNMTAHMTDSALLERK
jgi:hypothetical protein